MLEDTFVGLLRPKNNLRSVLSGKVFGPSTSQRTGYQVTITRDGGKKTNFVVANRDEVDQVITKAREAEKVLDNQ